MKKRQQHFPRYLTTTAQFVVLRTGHKVLLLVFRLPIFRFSQRFLFGITQPARCLVCNFINVELSHEFFFVSSSSDDTLPRRQSFVLEPQKSEVKVSGILLSDRDLFVCTNCLVKVYRSLGDSTRSSLALAFLILVTIFFA